MTISFTATEYISYSLASMFNKTFTGTFNGWAKQFASGPHLNLMYIYGHVMPELGGNHHIGYYSRCMLARTFLESAKQQKVTLQLSYDDALQVFLNCEKIYSDMKHNPGFVTRNLRAFLKKGKNRLLIKMLDTPNNNTCWAGISLRVLDINGNDLQVKSQ